MLHFIAARYFKLEVHKSVHDSLPDIVMPQSGSEPWFGPELLQTGPKSGSKFGIALEPNLKSGSGFGKGPNVVNLVQTELDPNLKVIAQRWAAASTATVLQVAQAPHALVQSHCLAVWHPCAIFPPCNV